MGIELVDLISMIVLPIGALIFLGLFLYLKGQWWWSTLSALLWILFGYASMRMLTPVFWFQRELAVAWIVIGISVIWMPAYYMKGKENKTLREWAEDDDNEEYKKESSERYQRYRESRGKAS